MKIKWAGHVARMGIETHIGFWWEDQEDRDH
jgi:hypothetical protein